MFDSSQFRGLRSRCCCRRFCCTVAVALLSLVLVVVVAVVFVVVVDGDGDDDDDVTAVAGRRHLSLSLMLPLLLLWGLDRCGQHPSTMNVPGGRYIVRFLRRSERFR